MTCKITSDAPITFRHLILCTHRVYVCHGDPRRRQQYPPFVNSIVWDKLIVISSATISSVVYFYIGGVGGLYALTIPFAFAFGWWSFQLRQTNIFIIKFQRMSKRIKSIQLIIWKNDLMALFGFKSVSFLLVVHLEYQNQGLNLGGTFAYHIAKEARKNQSPRRRINPPYSKV